MSLVDTRDDFERTVLNAVRSPLVLGDLTEDHGALVQKLVDDPVLGRLFEVLERVLVHDVNEG